jgi:hypothetical protein
LQNSSYFPFAKSGLHSHLLSHIHSIPFIHFHAHRKQNSLSWLLFGQWNDFYNMGYSRFLQLRLGEMLSWYRLYILSLYQSVCYFKSRKKSKIILPSSWGLSGTPEVPVCPISTQLISAQEPGSGVGKSGLEKPAFWSHCKRVHIKRNHCWGLLQRMWGN